MDNPHVVLLSMIEKLEDPQLRATLGYMAGMIKALELQCARARTRIKALELQVGKAED